MNKNLSPQVSMSTIDDNSSKANSRTGLRARMAKRERMAARRSKQLEYDQDAKYHPVQSRDKYIPAGENKNIPADNR